MSKLKASSVPVLAWASRILALPKSSAPEQFLDLRDGATAADAQVAFHRVARMAHPDLHRGLAPDDLEVVTSAYARVAGAYQAFREAPPGSHGSGPVPVTRTGSIPVTRSSGPIPVTRSAGPIPVTPSGVAPAATAAQQMSPRALVYYRKAELALRQGNLAAAVLQVKMAIAADPGSTFLRTALVEIERELRNAP